MSSGTNGIIALTRDSARRILATAHHRYQQSNLQCVSTALGASGPNLIQPHFTPSLLSSASLIAEHVRHRVLRNLEHMGNPSIRRTLDIVMERNPLWKHSTSQEARKLQCEQVEKYLEGQEKLLALQLKFETNNKSLEQKYLEVKDKLAKLRLAMTCIQDNVKGSLHPSSLLEGDKVFLTPSEAAKLPSTLGTIRGILIRIKGPRRGNRAMVWQKSAGRISTNSVKFVVSEEAKLGIPSKMGIFGLTVRIVYGRRNRLIDCRQALNLADQPNFTFTHL